MDFQSGFNQIWQTPQAISLQGGSQPTATAEIMIMEIAMIPEVETVVAMLAAGIRDNRVEVILAATKEVAIPVAAIAGTNITNAMKEIATSTRDWEMA
jgi:hypothetical protein